MINCLFPVSLPQGIVPCGHCILCANRKKREWIVRCILESRFHQDKCFITLTFDDEHLLDYGHRQVDLFLKRLRKNENVSFKYFGCFERGEYSKRPHFHILIFGWQPKGLVIDKNLLHSQEKEIAKYWYNGFVKIEELNEKSISYVCGYVQKKLLQVQKPKEMLWKDWRLINKWSLNDFDCAEKLKFDMIKQTYFFMSKGLGFSYFMGNSRNIEKIYNQKLSINGQYRITPRGFTNKLKKEIPELDWQFTEPFEKTFEFSLLSVEEQTEYFSILKNHNEVKANDLKFFTKM